MRSFGDESGLSEWARTGARAVWLTVIVCATSIVLGASPGKKSLPPNPPPPPGQTLYNVGDFPGVTAGDQITACMAALPPSGGVCDARSLLPPILIPSGLDISRRAEIIFGFGTIQLGATINIHDVSAVVVIGQSIDASEVSGTRFEWMGDSLSPAFKLSSVSRARLEHFNIFVGASNPLIAGIWLERDALNVMAPGTNRVEDVLIDSPVVPANLDKGVVIALGPGGDMNDDYNEFVDVWVRGYNTAGFSIEAGQSKMNFFRRCLTNGEGVGKYGITTALGQPGTGGGSFQWYGGGFTDNTVADVYLGPIDDAILIDGGYSEHSVRFLTTWGAASTAWPVTIKGFTWNADSLAADGNMIVYTQQGGLTLIGNTLGFPGKPARVLATCTAPSAVVAIGNSIMSTLAQPFVTSTTAAKWTLLGNMVSTDLTDGGNAVPVPNVVP